LWYRKNAVCIGGDMVDRNIGRGHWTKVKEEDMANTVKEYTEHT